MGTHRISESEGWGRRIRSSDQPGLHRKKKIIIQTIRTRRNGIIPFTQIHQLFCCIALVFTVNCRTYDIWPWNIQVCIVGCCVCVMCVNANGCTCMCVCVTVEVRGQCWVLLYHSSSYFLRSWDLEHCDFTVMCHHIWLYVGFWRSETGFLLYIANTLPTEPSSQTKAVIWHNVPQLYLYGLFTLNKLQLMHLGRNTPQRWGCAHPWISYRMSPLSVGNVVCFTGWSNSLSVKLEEEE